MSTPSNTAAPTSLWERLNAAPRPVKVVAFPRKSPMDGKTIIPDIAIRVLTVAEQSASVVEAQKFVRDVEAKSKLASGDVGSEDLFAQALTVEVLSRACRDVDDHLRPAFALPSQMRQALTTEEQAALLEHYQDALSELGPPPPPRRALGNEAFEVTGANAEAIKAMHDRIADLRTDLDCLCDAIADEGRGSIDVQTIFTTKAYVAMLALMVRELADEVDAKHDTISRNALEAFANQQEVTS